MTSFVFSKQSLKGNMAAKTEGASTKYEETEDNNDNSNFECNICLDVAKEAVISLCGHLFCWPCLHRWLETRPTRPLCPVCKAGISKDKVIPIYGRDNPSQSDPREKLPPRPQAQRPEPETNYNPFNGFPFGGPGNGLGQGNPNNAFQFSFGVGAFPFTLFSWTFGNNDNAAAAGTPQAEEERFLSRAFLWIALFFILWLVLV